jgi:hypothetical protein
MAIHFCGDVDDYEFYGEFDRTALAKAINPGHQTGLPEHNSAAGGHDGAKSEAPLAAYSHDAAGKAKHVQDDETRKDGEGPKKVIVRQLGGAYLLARFTAVAWSVWYGNQAEKMSELEPWRTFRNDELMPELNRLFERPRAFDNAGGFPIA